MLLAVAILWHMAVLAPLQHRVAPLIDYQPRASDGIACFLGYYAPVPRGGLRSNPGGRPKGTTGIKHKSTITKEQARDALRQIVIDNLQRLVDAQLSNATGIKYLVARHKKSGKFVRLTQDLTDKILDGQDDAHDSVEMWTKDPNVSAFTDLLNRALDKPKEQEQELQVHGKMIIEIAKGW